MNQLLRLNYHHLYYFYCVAQAGSITAAASQLRMSQPNLSAQLKLLEQSFAHQLFLREGRALRLSEMGKHVLSYAQQLYSLGNELLETIDGKSIPSKPLRIGIIDVVPKLLVHRVVLGAVQFPAAPKIICIEGPVQRLLADLAAHELDLLLTDSRIDGIASVKAYHHSLGECGISFMAVPKMAAKYRKNFPKSLDGAPLLLPTVESAIRRPLDEWFERQGIVADVKGEFQDSALMKIFGREGLGIFVIPSALEKEVRKDYGVATVGTIQDVRDRFFLISIEKRLTHPAIKSIIEQAHMVLEPQRNLKTR